MVEEAEGLLEVNSEVSGLAEIVDEFTVTELVLSLVVLGMVNVIDEIALLDSEAVKDSDVVVGISRVEL